MEKSSKWSLWVMKNYSYIIRKITPLYEKIYWLSQVCGHELEYVAHIKYSSTDRLSFPCTNPNFGGRLVILILYSRNWNYVSPSDWHDRMCLQNFKITKKKKKTGNSKPKNYLRANEKNISRFTQKKFLSLFT